MLPIRILSRLFLTLCAAALQATALCAAGADPAPASTPPSLHISGKVVTPDGKPAADAVVLLEVVDKGAHKALITRKATLTASGEFDFTLSQDEFKAALGAQPDHPRLIALPLYITSPAGVAVVSPPMGETRKTIMLQPFTQVRVRVLDSDSKPVAHVRLTPQRFIQGHEAADWDQSVSDLWTQETDTNGVATFSHLPQGSLMLLGVDDPQYALPDYRSNFTLVQAPETPEQTLHLVRGGSLSGQVLNAAKKPLKGAAVFVQEIDNRGGMEQAITDAEGRYQILRIAPGAYNLMVDPPAKEVGEGTAAAKLATVRPGVAQTGLNFSLVPGALLASKVTDKATGKPVANTGVSVNGPAHPSNSSGQYVPTGPDGTYQVRVPPGVQTLYVYGMEGGPQEVKVADGQTKTLNFQITPYVPPKPVHGVVLGADGKPAVGAEVMAATATGGSEQKTVADDKGYFVFDNPGLPAEAKLYARLGDAATPTGMAPAGDAEVTLHLAPNALTLFAGKVTDSAGKPLPNAKVALIRWQPGHGGTDVDTTQTDAQGAYHFAPSYSGFTYSIRAEEAGYGNKYSENIQATAGTAQAAPALVLAKADSVVAGIVVDPQGHPVAGAKVRDYDVENATAVTDSKGRFRINGVPSKTVVHVDAPENRWASVGFAAKHGEVTITVKSQQEEEAESKRFVKVMKADTTNHGDGKNANVLLQAAQARAAKNGRKVLLVFHASWCGPCFVLHRFLTDPTIQPIIDAHFVVQDLDIWEREKNGWENPGGVAIYKKYGGPNSVPFFAVLDASGRKRGDSIHSGENMGMPTQPGDVEFFLHLLKTTAPGLTAANLATLKAGLKRADTF